VCLFRLTKKKIKNGEDDVSFITSCFISLAPLPVFVLQLHQSVKNRKNKCFVVAAANKKTFFPRSPKLLLTFKCRPFFPCCVRELIQIPSSLCVSSRLIGADQINDQPRRYHSKFVADDVTFSIYESKATQIIPFLPFRFFVHARALP
jgi:hypothetical protein